MKLLKTIFKGLMTALIVAGLGFYVLANHSAAELQLVCSGDWTKNGEAVGPSERVAVVIEQYRPWVFWTDNYGNITAQAQNLAAAIYASKLNRIGSSSMAIFEFKHDVTGPVIGRYRAAFKELTLTFTPGMVFKGTCEDAHG